MSKNKLIAFRVSDEILKKLKELKEKLNFNSDSEVIRELIINSDLLISKKENDLEKIIEEKDKNLKNAYIQIGILKQRISETENKNFFFKIFK